LRRIGRFQKEALDHLSLRLCGAQLVLQATICDCLTFDPLAFEEQARLILIAHQVVVRINPAAIPAERDDLGVLADSTPGLAEHPADEGGNRWGDLHSINPVLVVRPKS
jgi:hypothetical protein